MAKTHYGTRITMDAVGVVKKDRIRVKSITLVPDAAGDSAVFKSWYDNGLKATVPLTAVVVSSGELAAAGTDYFGSTTSAAAGDIIDITYADLAANNGVATILESLASSSACDVAPTTDITDDAAGTYSWKIYTPVETYKVQADATSSALCPITEYPDRWFQNLALTSLSTSAVVYIDYE